MSKPTKYLYLYVLQGRYEGPHGWEDLGASESWREIRRERREYRENEGGDYRIVQRRELRQSA